MHKIIVGTWLPTGGINSMWLTSGLLLLIISTFILEPFFSTPKDGIANSLVALVSLLSIGSESGFILWKVACIFSIVVFVASTASAFLVEKPLSSNFQRNVSYALFRVSSLFGKGKVIFSILFLLSIFSFFSTQSPYFLALLLFWGIVIILKPSGIAALVDSFAGISRSSMLVPLGVPALSIYPNLIQIELSIRNVIRVKEICACKKNGDTINIYVVIEIIEFSEKSYGKLICIGEYNLRKGLDELTLHRLKKELKAGVMYLVKDSARLLDLSENIYLKEQSDVGGVVLANSNILQLSIELTDRELEMEEGSLVKTIIGNKRVFYQITNGITDSYNIPNGGTKSFIKGLAQQIGYWNSDSSTFEVVGWVPEIGQPIYIEKRHSDFNYNNFAQIPSRHIIGTIPKSNFPVHIDLNSVVTHHAAILGVTGSGKSCLCYDLVEALSSKGVKVICLDISGDYIKHINGTIEALAPNNRQQIEGYLAGARNIAVIDMTQGSPSTTLPSLTSSVVSIIFNWVKTNLPSQVGERVTAKVCIVFEEAHSLVPEWNTLSVAADRDRVNETSRLVLQGRKYGLGCVVVTQRTANVTKTILNQCNTIFAMQSFDQTGIEFLTNYMGEGYANVLPVLQFRHCVLFGKASSSKRPVIVELRERDFSHVAQS